MGHELIKIGSGARTEIYFLGLTNKAQDADAISSNWNSKASVVKNKKIKKGFNDQS